MKKLFLFKSVMMAGILSAQISTNDFESFTLSPSSSYTSSTSTPFQAGIASFQHTWNFNMWLGGFSYTNIQDSSNGTYTNVHGVKALKGYTNSAQFVVGQDLGLVKLTAPQSTVNGFYITNTTYAYKVIKNGNSFARKFGDTTGTHSPSTTAQGSIPDFFKVVIKGYNNGVLKNDSVEFFLADYRFANSNQDYIVNTWQHVNTASIGEVDSIRFFLRSTDVGSFGMNTPAFFAIDNFETSSGSSVGVSEIASVEPLIFPNPFNEIIQIKVADKEQGQTQIIIVSEDGRIVHHSVISTDSVISTISLQPGIYFLQTNFAGRSSVRRIIKE
jgi:hypothetical protein